MSELHDPSEIEITTDPLEQRFVGWARHGDMPFDVPYMSHIAPFLWMGGCETGLVLPPNIDHVVSLYRRKSYIVRHELHSALLVRMYDEDTEPDADQILALAGWVNACRTTGDVLVHCQAGLNRSGLIVAMTLIQSGECTPTEAIALIREKRSPAALCNPAFAAWIEDQ